MKRLSPEVFKVPIDRIRNGYYSDIYFINYVKVLKTGGPEGPCGFESHRLRQPRTGLFFLRG